MRRGYNNAHNTSCSSSGGSENQTDDTSTRPGAEPSSEAPPSLGLAHASPPNNGRPFTIQATMEMCHYCFDLLVAHLTSPSRSRANTTMSIIPAFLRSLPPSAECPVFVTWDKARRTPPSAELYELRGCIGTLAPSPLRTAIGEFALTSAFRDLRFNPISTHEVPHLRVAVSLLVNYEDCHHCHDWTIGVHGIIITFTHGSAQYSATYLPEVAKEQGWNQEEAVISLIRKAGFRGEVCSEFLRRVQCTRYQSSKQSITWNDYVSFNGTDPLGGSSTGGGSSDNSSGGSLSTGRQSRWRFPFSL